MKPRFGASIETFVVSIKSKSPMPAWFNLRVFSSSEDALKYISAITGNSMMMAPSFDTKTISEYSCGDLTVSLKRCVIDEECPSGYQNFYNNLMEGD